MFTKAQVFMVADQAMITVVGLLIAWWCLARIRRMQLAARERDVGPALATFAASFAASALLINTKGLTIPPEHRLHNWLDWTATLVEWIREDVVLTALVFSSVVAVCALLATLLGSWRPHPAHPAAPAAAAQIHSVEPADAGS